MPRRPPRGRILCSARTSMLLSAFPSGGRMTAKRRSGGRTGGDAELREITSGCVAARYGPRVAAADETPGAEGYPPILTTAQAAELLQVHVEYLRKMVRENRIPAHRFPEGRG